MHDTDDMIARREEVLRELSGPSGLLDVDVVAELLGRSPKSLKLTLRSTVRRQQPWAARLMAGRSRQGRHLHVQHEWVARALVLGDAPLSREEERRFKEVEAALAATAGRRRAPGRRLKDKKVGAEAGVAAPASAGQRS